MIAGLGPHGERAAAPERVALRAGDIEAARAARFRVAVVLHTLQSDWSKQHVAGIVATLGDCATAVVDVVDCGFAPDAQVAALDRLRTERPDAVISIPVANSAVAAAHRRVSEAGVRLMLLDNVPTGLLPGSDYVTLVSADNFGLGRIAAELLSPSLPQGTVAGIIAYDADFFVTNEREIAFEQWMRGNRPDVRLVKCKFAAVRTAGAEALALMREYPEIAGLFVVWDTPAMEAVKQLGRAGLNPSIATIDLGNEAAADLARGGMICGIGAQQPYLQGVAIAQATVLALLGQQTPAWVALSGLPVTRGNVIESYQRVWRAPAPREMIQGAGLLGRY